MKLSPVAKVKAATVGSALGAAIPVALMYYWKIDLPTELDILVAALVAFAFGWTTPASASDTTSVDPSPSAKAPVIRDPRDPRSITAGH